MNEQQRLRACQIVDEAMVSWDRARQLLIDGVRSSLPRDHVEIAFDDLACRIVELEAQLAEAREAMTKTVENCEGCGGEGSWYEAGHYVSCPECSLLRDALAGQGGGG